MCSQSQAQQPCLPTVECEKGKRWHDWLHLVPRELSSCPVQSCADLSTSTASGSCNGMTFSPNNDSLVSACQLKGVLVCPGDMQCDSGAVFWHRRQRANAIQSSKWHGHLECLTTKMSSFLVHNETANHCEHPVALARPTSTSSSNGV